MNLTSSSVDDYFGLKGIRSRIILQPAEFDGQAVLSAHILETEKTFGQSLL